MTSVADSKEDRRHVVAMEWNVRSGISKLRSNRDKEIEKTNTVTRRGICTTALDYWVISNEVIANHSKPAKRRKDKEQWRKRKRSTIKTTQ